MAIWKWSTTIKLKVAIKEHGSFPVGSPLWALLLRGRSFEWLGTTCPAWICVLFVKLNKIPHRVSWQVLAVPCSPGWRTAWWLLRSFWLEAPWAGPRVGDRIGWRYLWRRESWRLWHWSSDTSSGGPPLLCSVSSFDRTHTHFPTDMEWGSRRSGSHNLDWPPGSPYAAPQPPSPQTPVRGGSLWLAPFAFSH